MMLTTNPTKAHVYADNVDTDVIIPARYLNQSSAEHLAKYCMIDIDEAFANRVRTGDVIIAGKNFGCGSSREHAPLAIKASGVSTVIASSFARIFLRNAINIGLQVIEADTRALKAETGDEIVISFELGTLNNLSRGTSVSFNPPPPFIHHMIEVGGLVAYAKSKTGGNSNDDNR